MFFLSLFLLSDDKNTKNMQLSNMVETAKPVTRLLYTDKDTQRRGKYSAFHFVFSFFSYFVTAKHTVFTDEGMRFAWREPEERSPYLLRGQ